MKAIVTALALILTACGTESKDAATTLVAPVETEETDTTAKPDETPAEPELDWLLAKTWVTDWNGCDWTYEFTETEFTRTVDCSGKAQIEKGTYTRSATKITFAITHSTCAAKDSWPAATYTQNANGTMTIIFGSSTIIFEGQPLDSKPDGTLFQTGCFQTGSFVPSELNPV